MWRDYEISDEQGHILAEGSMHYQSGPTARLQAIVCAVATLGCLWSLGSEFSMVSLLGAAALALLALWFETSHRTYRDERWVTYSRGQLWERPSDAYFTSTESPLLRETASAQ